VEVNEKGRQPEAGERQRHPAWVSHMPPFRRLLAVQKTVPQTANARCLEKEVLHRGGQTDEEEATTSDASNATKRRPKSPAMR
jgi:hypothetical protein